MKIIIIHASAGAGHMKAAEALANALKKNTAHQVTLIDALDYTSPSFKKLYRNTYSTLISKFPAVWGVVFSFLDFSLLQPLIRIFRRLYNKINAGKLEQLIIDGQYDYVIATHFMPTEIASSLKQKNKIRSNLITVVTDFDVHKIWLGSKVDKYAVASSWTKQKMLSMHIPEGKVFITGIPTDEKFAQPKDVGLLKEKLGLERDVFTVLMATGSFGIGPIEETIKALSGFQVIVVCGHNKDLYERLGRQGLTKVKVCGLVDNMPELMAVSDVMVTKPGGLSISEALVSQLPLIFFNPIPGQETNNIKVLATYGIGVHAPTIEAIVSEVKRLSSSRDFYLTTLKRTQALACPKASADIISLIV